MVTCSAKPPPPPPGSGSFVVGFGSGFGPGSAVVGRGSGAGLLGFAAFLEGERVGEGEGLALVREGRARGGRLRRAHRRLGLQCFRLDGGGGARLVVVPLARDELGRARGGDQRGDGGGHGDDAAPFRPPVAALGVPGPRTAPGPGVVAAGGDAAVARTDVAVRGRRGPGRARTGVERHRREVGHEDVGGHQTGRVPGADGALVDVPGYSLTPERGRYAAPAAGQLLQQHARRLGRQRADHHAGGLQLVFHPLDPGRHVLGVGGEGGGDLGPGEFTGALQPPQRHQRVVLPVDPPRGLGDLPVLTGQTETADHQIHEVEVGAVEGRVVQIVRVLTDPGDRGRDQIRTEVGRAAQPVEAVDGMAHRLPRHGPHLGVPVQGVADELVDERQRLLAEPVPGRPVPGPRRLDL